MGSHIEEHNPEVLKDLPNAESKDIVLTHPTSEERLLHLRENAASWRGPLSLDSYVTRENHLVQQDLTKDGGLTDWALIDQSICGKRRVLSCCETINKKALVASKGIINETVCHGIGSVFASPEYRGKGYASRMMKDIGEKLKTWQTNTSPALFSVLFSDIGKKFYAQQGWRPFPSSHISLPPAELDPQKGLPKTKNLHRNDLAELCELDEKLLRESLVKSMAHSSKTFVALIPNVQHMQWHHAREEFVGRALLDREPQIKGALVGEPGKRVWCYWTRMWYNPAADHPTDNTLHILRLVVESKSTVDWNMSQTNDDDMNEIIVSIAAVLAAAQDEARYWNIEDVRLWNPNDITIKAAQYLHSETNIIHRDNESICCLRWYGDEKELDNIVWIENEKYGWC